MKICKLLITIATIFFVQSAASATLQYYQTSASLAGNAVACTTAYHVCHPGEWFRRKYNASASGAATGIVTSVASWYDMSTSATSNCNGWTSNSVGNSGYTATFDVTTATNFGWTMNAAVTCNLTRKVLCCSD